MDLLKNMFPTILDMKIANKKQKGKKLTIIQQIE